MKEYQIWCKSTINNEEKMFWCKSIYQKWDEEDYPYKRRAKRIFKLYSESNKAENRKFYLLEE